MSLHSASEPRSAFLADGTFTPDNWRCPIILDLTKLNRQVIYGSDCSMEVLCLVDFWHEDRQYDFLITSRYKTRGKTESAFIMSHEGHQLPLTRDIALKIIDHESKQRQHVIAPIRYPQ